MASVQKAITAKKKKKILKERKSVKTSGELLSWKKAATLEAGCVHLSKARTKQTGNPAESSNNKNIQV